MSPDSEQDFSSIAFADSPHDLPLAAEFVAARLKNRFLRTEMGQWLAWRERVWSRVDGRVVLENEFREYVTERIASPEVSSTERRQLEKYLDMPNVRRVVRAVDSDPSIAVASSMLDAQPNLLNFANGVVDLRTGTLSNHDRALLMTSIIPVDYDPNARHPDWERAKASLASAEMEWLLTFVGAAATGIPDRDSPVVFLVGDGSNGKSALLGALTSALGSHAREAPRELLSRDFREEHNALARLRGVRLAYAEEAPEGGLISSSRLKSLSETREITARLLYENFSTFTSTHSLVITSNAMPRVEALDWGLWRRIAKITFGRTYSGDEMIPGFRERLRAPEAMKAVLADIVAGAQRWHQADRRLVPTASMLAERDRWRRDSDHVGRFLDECAEVTHSAVDVIPSKDLHASYEQWRVDEAAPSMSLKAFVIVLQRDPKLRFEVVARRRSVIGVRFRSDVTVSKEAGTDAT